MALVFTFDTPKAVAAKSRRDQGYITGSVAFDSSYPSGGELLTDLSAKFKSLKHVQFDDDSGYIFSFDKTNNKVKVYLSSGTPTLSGEAAHTHAIALDSGASAAGSSHNHVFTGTIGLAPLLLASPAFFGTGLTAAGQVMTTTDNQTMTLNQCAGMWLLPATAATPPMLIVSNTAVTGAPAVLTVIGAAATDAGAYTIVCNSYTPVGTNAAEATHTHGAGTLADAASGVGSSHTHTATGEVAEETTGSLAALTAVKFFAVGTL